MESLEILAKVFLEPLLAQSVLPIQHIFGQVQVILNLSKVLLEQLKERVSAWDHRQCLADIFVQLYNYMKVYTQYVKDYSVLSPKLQICKKDPEFRKICRAAEKKKEAKKMELESLLIMPIQRIPRYQMLIEVITGCEERERGG